MENKELVSKIASLRSGAGLTQLELSQKVGVTESTIANWETGRSDLKWIEKVIRLCDALNCQPKDLIAYQKVSHTEILERHRKNKQKSKVNKKQKLINNGSSK